MGIGLLMLLALCTGSLNYMTIFALPTFIGLGILLSLGCGLWLSALTVEYRDFRFIVPFVVQFGMFISPVGYGTFVIPEQWRWLFFLNPMVGIIDGFRWAFFGISHPYILFSIGISSLITFFLLLTGFLYFRQMERTFADRI
jgi:lipopolysaccharide transport system permease protein